MNVQNLQSNVIFLLLAKMFILEHSKQIFKIEKKSNENILCSLNYFSTNETSTTTSEYIQDDNFKKM